MPFLSPNQQCQSTEGKNITSHGLAHPKLTWGLPTLSLTTNSSWLPWGRVAMPLISPLMPVSQQHYIRVRPLFQHWFSITFPGQKKMKILDLSAQHIFPSKWYTIYECVPELVATVPSARSTIVKWSRVTFTELLSAVVKIPWHYHHFPWLSMTTAIFHDFSGLENGLTKFHDQGAPCYIHKK